jgi:beta-N-acetylhexosaminidase
MKPIVFGLAGPRLTAEEAAFFKACDPLGFILFQRNIEDPEQVVALIAALRATVGRADAPIFIDQEGGRAVRLKPPHWPRLPSMRAIGTLYARDAASGRRAMFLHARLTADRLYRLGIVGNYAPVLDLRIEGASDVIGDRSLGDDPSMIADLGHIACATYLANGVIPCIKHLPGHGRMEVDPHHELPTVRVPLAELEVQDFAPFRALADAPMGMTSHGIFTALDPVLPASISPTVHEKYIRGALGFDGLLFTDDLAMKALSGSIAENARLALAAGSDIALYCWGDMAVMQAIDAVVAPIGALALARWQRALSLVSAPSPHYDAAPAWAELVSLLGQEGFDH